MMIKILLAKTCSEFFFYNKFNCRKPHSKKSGENSLLRKSYSTEQKTDCQNSNGEQFCEKNQWQKFQLQKQNKQQQGFRQKKSLTVEIEATTILHENSRQHKLLAQIISGEISHSRKILPEKSYSSGSDIETFTGKTD